MRLYWYNGQYNIKLENIGRRIDMQTHVGNGRKKHGYTQYPSWSLATVRP